MNKYSLLVSLLVATFCTSLYADKVALREKLADLVESGKLSKPEAIELFRIAVPVDEQADRQPQEAKPKIDLEKLGEQLKQAVKDGELTPKQAILKYQAVAKMVDGKGVAKDKGAAKVRGKGDGIVKGDVGGKMKGRNGRTNFYAIVIGRLKTKDIELGEFTMDVDYVSSMYGNRWVKDEIIGKRVTVTGVSGPFLDKLLTIRRGKTLKVRSGGFEAKTNTLTFAHKFHVLEETAPFDADEFGVPPEESRGFDGVLTGKIVDLGGYELLLSVDEVVSVSDRSQAKDAKSIAGKRVRVVGFFNDHADAFNELHAGDDIRVSVRHRDAKHDEFQATEELEHIKPQDVIKK